MLMLRSGIGADPMVKPSAGKRATSGSVTVLPSAQMFPFFVERDGAAGRELSAVRRREGSVGVRRAVAAKPWVLPMPPEPLPTQSALLVFTTLHVTSTAWVASFARQKFGAEMRGV